MNCSCYCCSKKFVVDDSVNRIMYITLPCCDIKLHFDCPTIDIDQIMTICPKCRQIVKMEKIMMIRLMQHISSSNPNPPYPAWICMPYNSIHIDIDFEHQSKRPRTK
jgi:hypothetical protein